VNAKEMGSVEGGKGEEKRGEITKKAQSFFLQSAGRKKKEEGKKAVT